MSVKVETIMYTKDELMKLNVYTLRKIPNEEKYMKICKFVSDEKNVNLSNVVKQSIVPTYLKNRYGDTTLVRGNFQDKQEISRRKIYVSNNVTNADKINEEIRDLLSKLSEGNKDKLLGELVKKDIPDECGQTLINNIYIFSVDLSYLIPIYVEIIFILKNKNLKLYNQLIEKIITTACEPLTDDPLVKRLRMGNIMLISEIYRKNMNVIDTPTIMKIITFLFQQISPQKTDYLQMLCELLKRSISHLQTISSDSEPFNNMIQKLQEISYDRAYEKRLRFLVQDVVDTF